MQRAAIKKQLFLKAFDFEPPSGISAFGTVSVTLAASLAAPLVASNMTCRVWLDVRSEAALQFEKAAEQTHGGSWLVEV